MILKFKFKKTKDHKMPKKSSKMKCNTPRCIVLESNQTQTQRGVEVYEIYALKYGRKKRNWQLLETTL